MSDTKNALQVEGGSDLRRLLRAAHAAITDRSVHLDDVREFQEQIGDGLCVDMSVTMWFDDINGNATNRQVRLRERVTRHQVSEILEIEIDSAKHELEHLADLISKVATAIRTGSQIYLSREGADLVGWKVPDPRDAPPPPVEATNPNIEIETEEAE